MPEKSSGWFFLVFFFFDDGGILSATGDRDRVEAFYVQGKKIR